MSLSKCLANGAFIIYTIYLSKFINMMVWYYLFNTKILQIEARDLGARVVTLRSITGFLSLSDAVFSGFLHTKPSMALWNISLIESSTKFKALGTGGLVKVRNFPNY